ncbi:hypothetical protein [uncultured Jatrophihabitans sp.]|uniref:hypothetical protein n=1 Tax=uncultured Jatrophihabitans sp. TaxID=1610747 RepID=UPI0035C9480E
MTNQQRTDSERAASRATDVRAHERAQYATPPTYPTYLPTEQHPSDSPNARTNGSADARENPPAQAAHQPILDDDFGPWRVGYRVDRITGNAVLLGFKPPITDMMKRKRWAVLIAGEGWAVPLQYLAHIERLLTGADVTLFDIDGNPTPAQRAAETAEEQRDTAAVLADIRAARDAAEADPTATARERSNARQAFRDALARTHPDQPDTADVTA